MARLSRPNIIGCPQHIIQRGNNRQPCFFSERDFKVYLAKLKEFSEKYKIEIHAYVLMTNHVHILATPLTDYGVSKMMQSLGRYYVRYFNHTHGRTGTLWEGRYKSTLIDSEQYLLIASRYIELNPVRAHMVKHPSEYPWSSYQGNALNYDVQLLTPHFIYTSLGSTASERHGAYQALFDHELSNDILEEIRNATNKSWILGDSVFRKKLSTQTKGRLGRASRNRWGHMKLVG